MILKFLSLKGLVGKVAGSTALLFAYGLCVQSISAAETITAEARALISDYQNTSNVVLKRQVLRQVTAYSKQRGSLAADWQKEILRDALQHKDPTVVESAVHQIGELNLSEFNLDIISLYHKAQDLYANVYDRRVMISIVMALEKTGKNDQNVFNLFQQILDPSKTSFTYIQGDVLNAIQGLEDSRYIPIVEKYRNYMDGVITMKESAGEDIMMYQVFVGYKTLCETIIQELRQ